MGVLLILESRLQFSFLGRSEHAEHAAPVPYDDPPDMRAQDVFIVEQATAEKSESWELFAEEIAFYDTARLALVTQLRAELFPRDVEPLQLTAERGQINSSTGDMTVEGGVVLRPLWGYDLETAVLHWDAANRTLHTDAEVGISAETIDIAGTGFSGSVDQQHFALQRRVRVSFH
jgi:LPS export ABC transporter protein LptC